VEGVTVGEYPNLPRARTGREELQGEARGVEAKVGERKGGEVITELVRMRREQTTGRSLARFGGWTDRARAVEASALQASNGAAIGVP
jgi:hypothetical protein